MPITIHCPHDKTELVLVPDKKTPEGLLECQKCHCMFRVSLAIFDHKCYGRMYPQEKGYSTSQTPKKRGRPKDPTKVLHKSIEENKEVSEALGSKKVE